MYVYFTDGYTTKELIFEWIQNKENAVQFSDDLELPEFDPPQRNVGNCTLEYLTGKLEFFFFLL